MSKILTSPVSIELAKEQNRPVELYRVYLDQQTLYLANWPENISFFTENGTPQTYTAFSLSRSAVKTNVSSRCDEVSVEFGDVDLTMSGIAAYSDLIGRRCHIICIFLDNVLPPNEPDPDDFISIFDGKMDNPEISMTTVSIKIVYSLDFLGLTLPRRKYQRNCGWRFGSTECGKSLGTVTGTVSNINETGLIFTLSGRTEAVNYYVDGSLIVGSERRKILASNAGSITVDYPFDYAIIGNNYTVRRGCDKTYETCDTRFDNALNYGGFLSVPSKRTILRT